MKKQYHILNGDALKEQFPQSIEGTVIVARECLVDGNVDGRDLTELYVSRAKYLSQNYGVAEREYYAKTVSEFQRVLDINDDSDINLWFEDDLFCQVNFWFISSLLNSTYRNNNVYLVRPELHSQYGFGGLMQSVLISIYKNRIKLTELEKIASLWVSFQNDDTDKLIDIAQQLELVYPFILPAVRAHIDRKPSNEQAGRPTESLKAIMRQLGTEDFEPVFREFCKKESIYGFGDLHVKRLLEEIKTTGDI